MFLDSIEVFTTRPDTVMGVTYLVLAPEHPLVGALTSPEQRLVTFIVYVCMYVCMYVCYLYVYVCMYVCMYVCICLYMVVSIYVCICLYRDFVYVCMYVFMNA